MTSFKIITLLCLLTSLTQVHAAQWDIIHAGKLLAVPGEAVAEEQSVILKDGKVYGIENGYIDADDLAFGNSDSLEIHNLKNHFVMPGFIDGHVHLTLALAPGAALSWVQMSDADTAMLGAKHARDTLMAGFTSVRDMGAFTDDAIFAVRDGINAGYIIGPRTFVAGNPIAINGGHGDFTHSFKEPVADVLRTSGVCDGVAECRKAVRDQIRRKADHIKLTATAGVMSDSNAGLEQQFFEDELTAIMDTAKLMGRRIAAHAHGAEGINAALKAGANTIEHGTFLDEESIRLFIANDAYLSPTLSAFSSLEPALNDPNSFLTDNQRVKAEQAMTVVRTYVEKAHKAGVKIALSTDAGVGPHGDNAKEFELLVKYGGMTPMEAIIAGTLSGAENLGKLNELGSLEAGKWGDIVAVNGNPLDDITILQNISFVMKEGVVYKKIAD
ncbi:amidohydrolase family protein [Glaciecola sp. XM2]|jgi:imidazolonepropionase-like amidohydrolase|uniref:metal-dependent hydrolase family protein n=1 Tax=Glaciecola sp. XM2 TaxID=1914931 RepID=UPI001BDE48E0|nr:amidohydrolase family protein [Glaciecola sp. XM2]MBT1449991.1 amidohydrolase family protein [Glaciecola sp. XM2]